LYCLPETLDRTAPAKVGEGPEVMSRAAPLPHYRKRHPTTQRKENSMRHNTTTTARFLFWLTGFLPCRIIDGDDGPYLERYHLAGLFGWQFYLHRFVASDPDRGLHDHPWRLAFSLILSGFYFEETRAGTRVVRWFNWLTGDSFHRVVLPFHTKQITQTAADYTGPIVQCWTLFFHGPNVKPWGFWRPIPFSPMATFEPYTYQREGQQDKWWKTARRGNRAPGRAPL